MDMMSKLGQIRDKMDDIAIEESAPKDEIELPCMAFLKCSCCSAWLKSNLAYQKVLGLSTDHLLKRIEQLEKQLAEATGKKK